MAIGERSDAEFSLQCESDRSRLIEIRSAREASASDYFARYADEWDELRRLHSSDRMVEKALVGALCEAPVGRLLDIGTGTGRMAELFAPLADHIIALDKSLEMLRVARAKLQHLPTKSVELVQGDFTDLPFSADSFDTVMFHQVLHFAQEPKAVLAEAARVTRPGGRIAIVDFGPHKREELRERHAHMRLGFGNEQITRWLERVGFAAQEPVALTGGELVVKIWVGTRRVTRSANAITKGQSA